MATYFFDFTDGTDMIQDGDGHNCEGVEAARLDALRVLSEAYVVYPVYDDEREVSCIVRDEIGAVVYHATLALKGEMSLGR